MGNWAGSKVKCDLCSNIWIAVFEVTCEKLECPNCKNIVYYEILDEE